MSPARKRAAAHEEGNSERWLLTYADMITLLLALFIVLFSFSSIDVKKFLELRLGLTAAFNPSAVALSGGPGLLNQTSLASSPGSSSSNQAVLTPEQGTQSSSSGSGSGSGGSKISGPSNDQIQDEIQQALNRGKLNKAAEVTQNQLGVVVQILADKVYYATDSASLGPVGQQIVNLIATVVLPDPNNIVVEGYTDDVPVTGGPYSSNWELSSVRAANVVQQLNAVDGVPESRLSAAGYGENDPEESNSTAAGRAANRRIDVVVLNSSASAPALGSSTSLSS